jgi:type II secretory pathway pseudopilin PulG
MKKRGFTLIETILYIALLVIIMSAILPLSLQILGSGAKSTVGQEVYGAARYTSERIAYEIRNAASLNTASSSFNVNLATSSGAGLYLSGFSSSTDPTIIRVDSGTATIIQGTGTPVALNSSGTLVTNLIFSNYSSTSTNRNVGFVLGMANAGTSTRQEFQASTTIRMSVELRSF